jgi:uncharacterized protein YggE
VQDDDPVQLGALAGRIMDTALESGANSVQQLSFFSKAGLAQARQQALTQVGADALANARALATDAHSPAALPACTSHSLTVSS